MKRQLQRVAAPTLESQIELSFLHREERHKLCNGECRCYLARDSRGAITFFLALSFGGATDTALAVQSEYSRSLRREDTDILHEFGISSSRKSSKLSEK